MVTSSASFIESITKDFVLNLNIHKIFRTVLYYCNITI